MFKAKRSEKGFQWLEWWYLKFVCMYLIQNDTYYL